jgi:hypothetical protein
VHDGLQEVIARGMALLVVDALEPVDVDERDGERLARAVSVVDGPSERLQS